MEVDMEVDGNRWKWVEVAVEVEEKASPNLHGS